MPMSFAKPICVSKVQPEWTIVIGSARKVLLTKPPSVTAAHTSAKTTKKATPSAARALGATGVSGLIRSLDVARVGELRKVRHRLDDARLEQQIGRLLAERGVLAG